jgi:peptidoglycan hydrolase-like protein with peptidoglycan-binding domain
MPLALLSVLPSALAMKTSAVIPLFLAVQQGSALAYPSPEKHTSCVEAGAFTCLQGELPTPISLSTTTLLMCGTSEKKGAGCFDSKEPFGVIQYQMQLKRHCPSLPDNFADGKDGPATRRALKQFQAAYGLKADGVYGPQTATALAGPVNGKCE